jgi:hypothetical protein
MHCLAIHTYHCLSRGNHSRLSSAAQADLNVTLTAISQLWNAADFLAHARPARQTDDIDRSRISEIGFTVLDAAKYVELLELLLSSLQVQNMH